MHQVVFYPVGNGDTSQIILENGKRLLFDFHHLKKTEEGEGPEINLKERLRDELKKANKTSFDVVAFTHGDCDHIENSTEFFELRHATKYQGKDRIKIDQLWVPAGMVLERATNDEQSNEFVIWRDEARYRLKEGKGVRVFSRPDKLKDWIVENGLTPESRAHLITDAGQLVPDFSLTNDGVEFFCHSPFIKHCDDQADILRNEGSLIFNVRFQAGANTVDYFAVGDSTWDVLEDIVRASDRHKNEDRYAWDLYNIPHHCSYLALSSDKGETETKPMPLVAKLLLAGKRGAHIVCSSKPIESTPDAHGQLLPPHVQAKKCYEHYQADNDGGQFYVTMEEPSIAEPEPLTFYINDGGISRLKDTRTPAVIITSAKAPRAG